MTLQQSLTNVQNEIEEIRRNHKFNKANKDRNAAIKERTAIMRCNGTLKQSLMKFKTTIVQQSLQIQEGIRYHRDTILQEQTLWDAAIGYMLVQDAQYALGSLYSYDSVEYAYGLLNKVTKYMNGDRLVLPAIAGVRRTKDRNVAGYMTSDAAYKEKSDFLDTFFEELKKTGDIEGCMKKARNQPQTSSIVPNDPGTGWGELVNQIPGSGGTPEIEIPEPTGGINVPKNTAVEMDSNPVSTESNVYLDALNSLPDDTETTSN